MGVGGCQCEIVQFYCELVVDELVCINIDVVMVLLDKVLVVDCKSVCVIMLIGDVLCVCGDIEGVLEMWWWVEYQSVLYIVLVVQCLMDGYIVVGCLQEGINLLCVYLVEVFLIDLLEVVFKVVLDVDGIDVVNVLVSDELCCMLMLLGLDKFFEVCMMSVFQIVCFELVVVKILVYGYMQKLVCYQCSYCGFKVCQFYW